MLTVHIARRLARDVGYDVELHIVTSPDATKRNEARPHPVPALDMDEMADALPDATRHVQRESWDRIARIES